MNEPSTFSLQPSTGNRVAVSPEAVASIAETLGVRLLPGEAEVIAPDLATALALWRRIRSRFDQTDEPILLPEVGR